MRTTSLYKDNPRSRHQRPKKERLTADQAEMRKRIIQYKLLAKRKKTSLKLRNNPPRCDMHDGVTMHLSPSKLKKTLVTLSDFTCLKCAESCRRISRRIKSDSRLHKRLTGGVTWNSQLSNSFAGSTQERKQVNKWVRSGVHQSSGQT